MRYIKLLLWTAPLLFIWIILISIIIITTFVASKIARAL